MCSKDHKLLYGFYRQILCMNKTLCIILLIIPFMQGIHIGPTTSLWLLRVLYSCCLCKNNIYVVCFQQTWMHHTYDENMIRPQRISWINLSIYVSRVIVKSKETWWYLIKYLILINVTSFQVLHIYVKCTKSYSLTLILPCI